MSLMEKSLAATIPKWKMRRLPRLNYRPNATKLNRYWRRQICRYQTITSLHLPPLPALRSKSRPRHWACLDEQATSQRWKLILKRMNFTLTWVRRKVSHRIRILRNLNKPGHFNYQELFTQYFNLKLGRYTTTEHTYFSRFMTYIQMVKKRH